MKRSFWRPAWAAVVLAAALGCSKSSPQAAAKDTLVRHLIGDPARLDPVTMSEEFGLRVMEMLFRSLVSIDKDRRLVPGLALSWTVSPDGRTYTFALDPKARWEDGTPVTSEDVRFTLERILDPKAGATNWRGALEDLEGVATPDPSTARVTFRKTYAERLLALTVPIVNAAAYRRAPEAVNRSPVGSGPYRLESWETNQKLVLTRRADASESEAPFRRLIFRVIPDGNVTFQAGARGELDEFRITRDQRLRAEKNPEFLAKNRILRVPQFLQVLIVWNCRHPFLADPRVRRALALAWQRAETARLLYPPDGATLVSGPYPAGVAENDPAIAPPPFDPSGSARLLDEAGYRLGSDGVRRKAGKKASIEMLFAAGQPTSNLAEILRLAYGKVGVELVLRPLDWAAFAERSTAGEFDGQLTARIFQPPTPDPYPYFHSSQGSPSGGNLGFYVNAEADRVMETAESELDPAKRLALYRQVHRLLAADPPADFLWSVDQYWAVSKAVDGVVVSPIGLFHFVPGPLAWRPAAPPR